MCVHVCLLKCVEKIKLAPDYNPKAKQENKLYQEKRVSDICPTRPPNEELADSLAKEYQENPGHPHAPGEFSEQPLTLGHPKMMAIRKNSNGKSRSVEHLTKKNTLC